MKISDLSVDADEFLEYPTHLKRCTISMPYPQFGKCWVLSFSDWPHRNNLVCEEGDFKRSSLEFFSLSVILLQSFSLSHLVFSSSYSCTYCNQAVGVSMLDHSPAFPQIIFTLNYWWTLRKKKWSQRYLWQSWDSTSAEKHLFLRWSAGFDHDG